jgi:hypothetical protein
MAQLVVSPTVQQQIRCQNTTNWADSRNGVTQFTGEGGYLACYVIPSTYYGIRRLFVTFDTSALPDNAIIDSASVDVNNGGGTLNIAQNHCLVTHTSASNTTIVASDFTQLTLNSPPEGATRQAMRTDTQTQTFALNATGLSWISLTGYTKLCLRSSLDVDNSQPALGNNSVICGFGSLTINYHLPVTGNFFNFF